MENEVWFSPSQIHYLRDDVIWMIAEVLPLEAGQWTPEPVNTGYVGNQKTKTYTAPFEKPGQVRAEVEERIKMTKQDGETLVWEIQHGIDYYYGLCPAAKMALNYICSGGKRRRVSYSKWRYDRKRKNRKKSENNKGLTIV